MHRNITYRLIPGARAKALKVVETAGACRYVWNRSLASARRRQDRFVACRQLMLRGAMPGGVGVAAMSEIALEHANRLRPPLTFFNLGKQFTKLRASTPWLRELPFAPVRHVLKYQADSWKRAFSGEAGYPTFKKRSGNDSFTIPQDVRIHSTDGGKNSILHIPKVGRVVLRRSGGNPYEGSKALQAVVKQVLGRWYCTVCYEVEDRPSIDNGTVVGVDFNCGQIATSDGVFHRMPNLVPLEARRRRYQRMMARRVKGSKRYGVARHRCAKVSRKLAMIRGNWQHHATRELAEGSGAVVIEGLNTKGMTASAKGTADKPDRNVRAKAGLNRAILATGWHGLKQKLDYKALNVIEVPGAYTSQECRECGHTASENRRSQESFICVACGHRGNADVNAALNILARATGLKARGTGDAGRRGAWALAPPMNRQQDIPAMAA